MTTPITDPADPRLADYVGLRDPQGRRVAEAAHGIFVAEGATVLERLLQRGLPIRSVLVLPKRLDRVLAMVEGTGVEIFVAERDVLEAVTGFDLHRGIVASAVRPEPPTLEALLASARVVALEGLNDPENLGAIARTARAFGADGLLLDPTCADPYARRTVRVSMGELLFLPVVRAEAWPDALTTCVESGFQVVALTPAADAIDLRRLDPSLPTVLLVGAEGPGLSGSAQRAATVRARIPIDRGVDSLNVGHATAVALAWTTTFGTARP
ncbi:MAG: RNA methyltransferase [Ilumatobacteraceae bacterium]